MATIIRRIGKHGQLSYRVQVRRKGAPPLSETFSKLSDSPFAPSLAHCRHGKRPGERSASGQPWPEGRLESCQGGEPTQAGLSSGMRDARQRHGRTRGQEPLRR